MAINLGLYLLSYSAALPRPRGPCWVHGFLVAARNRDEARAAVAGVGCGEECQCGDARPDVGFFPSCVWLDDLRTSCRRVGCADHDVTEGVLLVAARGLR